MSNQNKGDPKAIPFNAAIEQLRPDPNAPPEDVQRFAGYFGRSTMKENVRLYLSLGDLSTYVEIPVDQIVHKEEVPEAVMEGQAYYVWVKQDAVVALVTRRSASLVAGEISSQVRPGDFPHPEACASGAICAGTRGTCPPPLRDTLLCPSALGCFIDSGRKLFEALQERG